MSETEYTLPQLALLETASRMLHRYGNATSRYDTDTGWHPPAIAKCEPPEDPTDHDVTCHYRIAVQSGARVQCPHGGGDGLECDECYPCTCKEPREAAA